MIQSFIGSGIVEIAPYDAAIDFYSRPFRDTGNNNAFSYSFAETERNRVNFRSPAGGTYASAPRIDTVTGSISMGNLNPDNLALALRGAATSAGTTAIPDEAHVLHAGKFVPTRRLINTSVAPVVEKGATVIDTDDYTVSEHGITFAATITTATVVDGDDITISYTPKATIDVQSLLTGAQLVSIFLRGFDAVSGEPHSLAIWRAKLGAPANVEMIGEDFATLELPFTMEEDPTITGEGLSKYFYLQQVGA
jgi:hypothetical protein